MVKENLDISETNKCHLVKCRDTYAGQIKNKDKTIPKGDMEGNEEARGLELKSKEGGLHIFSHARSQRMCLFGVGCVFLFCFICFSCSFDFFSPKKSNENGVLNQISTSCPSFSPGSLFAPQLLVLPSFPQITFHSKEGLPSSAPYPESSTDTLIREERKLSLLQQGVLARLMKKYP